MSTPPRRYRYFRNTVVGVLAGTLWSLIGALPVPAIDANTVAPFPIGITARWEPSGMAPPTPTALAHYRQTYVTDFNGRVVPPGWDVFGGTPGGDPGGQFDAHHVVVTQGLLRLKVWRDPRYQNRWVTGGLCQCGRPMTYGAFFVRSRVTGVGPNTAELLWPRSNVWPPEIDFNEDLGQVNLTTATLHWTPGNQTEFRILRINMFKWHTWGVIWTPTSVTYVVDGHPWHEVSLAGTIPHIPMDLNFEQRTGCFQGRDCPTQPSAVLIDWVAEYRPTTPG